MRLIDADAFAEYIKNVIKTQKYDSLKVDDTTLTVADVLECVVAELEGTSIVGFKNNPTIEPEQRWISCSERLPEDEYVLISKKPTKILGSKWSVVIAIRTADPRSGKIQWRDSGFGVIQDDKVLAWMPLPEPARLDGEANEND